MHRPGGARDRRTGLHRAPCDKGSGRKGGWAGELGSDCEGPRQCALKIWFGMQISIAVELAHKFK